MKKKSERTFETPCSIIAEISRVKFTYLLGWYPLLSPTDGGVMPYREKIELRVARARCNWFRGCTRWD